MKWNLLDDSLYLWLLQLSNTREDKADTKQLRVRRQNKALYNEGLISLYLLKKKVYFLKEAMICCKVNSSVTYRNS